MGDSAADLGGDPKQVLAAIPLFADVLGADGINALAAASHPAFFRSGTLLMSQGDLGGSMFAIVNGTVAVNFLDKDGREKQVATLGPGEVVGEMSMFTGDRRTATVTAQTNVNRSKSPRPRWRSCSPGPRSCSTNSARSLPLDKRSSTPSPALPARGARKTSSVELEISFPTSSGILRSTADSRIACLRAPVLTSARPRTSRQTRPVLLFFFCCLETAARTAD